MDPNDPPTRRAFAVGALGAGLLPTAAGAQPVRRAPARPERTVRRPSSPPSFRGRDPATGPAEPPRLSPADRRRGEAISTLAQAAVLRALIAEPGLVARDPNPVQRRAVQALGGLSATARTNAQRAVAQRVDAFRRRRGIDLRAVPTLSEVERRYPDIVFRPPPPPPPPPPQRRYSRLELLLNRATCISETSGSGADEIIVGVTLIGETGNLRPLDARYLGQYAAMPHVPQTRNFNDQLLGRWSLTHTPDYPKELMMVAHLVETDAGSEQEAAGVLSESLVMVAAMVEGLVGDSAPNAIAWAMVDMSDNMLPMFNDYCFPASPGVVRLPNEDAFLVQYNNDIQYHSFTGDEADYRVYVRYRFAA